MKSSAEHLKEGDCLVPNKGKSKEKLELSSAWEIPITYYDLEEVVGEGSYGQVIKGVCKKTHRDVAIKFIQNVCESEYDCVKVIREVQLMRRLSEIPGNTHTIELIDLLLCPKDRNNSMLGLFIVMEYFDSDLKHVMSAAPSMEDFTMYHTL